ncbi:hypothetical protein MPSEU_000232200 [Mayamaea pseudoterrestris]|nr:hypothetical protein MPSEU_000232200 [Mayamaea pseudoterrestris]
MAYIIETTMTTLPSKSTTTFRAIGFCGVDDSVDPGELIDFAAQYPQAEFGVLFRPDLEGTPRYASRNWVEQLVKLVLNQQQQRGNDMKLAAHLCGSRVNQVLDATPQGLEFLRQLEHWGFRRIQINATAVNGVDTSRLAESATSLIQTVANFPNLEFILQKNDETRPLWEALLQKNNASMPKNVSMLVDESKGTGLLAKTWPSPPADYEIGYAGGIGSSNVQTVIQDIQSVAPGRSVWIDMESSLRTVNDDGTDIFDLDKCRKVMQIIIDMGVSLL